MKKRTVSIGAALGVFVALCGHVGYQLGGKAPERPYFQTTSPTTAPLEKIEDLDCSGFVRLDLYRAWNIKVPDGSQAQREYCEKLAADPNSGVRRVDYRNAARYMTPTRLFIAFIRPGYNGCGAVGHVWLLVSRNGQPMTLESHSGTGVDSRAWNSPTLLRQVYSCYELPTKK